jgi:hypothetical protein
MDAGNRAPSKGSIHTYRYYGNAHPKTRSGQPLRGQHKSLPYKTPIRDLKASGHCMTFLPFFKEIFLLHIRKHHQQ